jgi:hypothetical protein
MGRDWKDRGVNLDLEKREKHVLSLGVKARQVSQVFGTSSTSQSAVGSTVPSSTAALDPEFCRWLMGYPKEWDVYVDMGTR